jgi:hypothetical protein
MGAVHACLDAIKRSKGVIGNRERVIADGCAGMIVDEKCRAAFVEPDAPHERHVAHMREVCAAAYCPALSDPKPDACRGPTDDLSSLWHAINVYDLGPKATAAFESAIGPPPGAPLPPGAWRLPILLITPDAVELDWRSPSGPDVVAVTEPLASWTCPPLHDALVHETVKTWGRTSVRPAESENLMVSVDPKAPDATVMAILNCVNDPSAPRPPYKDVVIRPEASQ